MLGFGLQLIFSCDGSVDYSDTLPPITLLGNAVDTAYFNTTYRTPDPAAIVESGAFRRQDIKVTGSVNTTMPGTYYLDYDYTDPEGKRAATVTRTVHVVMTKFDSIDIQQTLAMYKSIGLPSYWKSGDSEQQLRIKTSTEPLIYIEYQNKNSFSIYNLREVRHDGDKVNLITMSHFGDTVCYWMFEPQGANIGIWSIRKPALRQQTKLGLFVSDNTTGQTKIH